MLVLFGISLIGLGCGSQGSDQPDLGDVQGTVTLDGEPLVGVIVVFTPEKGRQSTGLTDVNGKYELHYMHHSKGAKLGNHTVGFASAEAEEGDFPQVASIPAKYAYGTDRGLKEEVKEGNNTFDFALTSE